MATCLGKRCSFVNCMCLSWTLVTFCVCPSFPFAIEGGMWDVIILIPDYCIAIYFNMLRLFNFLDRTQGIIWYIHVFYFDPFIINFFLLLFCAY